MRVTVAVLTFRREEYLAPLIGDLEREIGRLDPEAAASVPVVDNDPDGSGVAKMTRLHPSVPLTCVLEPRPGIAAARNRALRECEADDLLVFIDDDERPDPGWLSALVTTYARHSCAAVSGPVRTVYGGEVDPWVEAGRFVDRSHRDGLRTGDLVMEAATNNLLLDLRVVRRLDLRFDESLRLSGGEDSLFTRQLTRAGEQIVWCAEAWVCDLRPGERTTRRAALRRTYSFANASTTVKLKLAENKSSAFAARADAVATGATKLAAGSVSLLVGTVVKQLPWQANGARLMARGLGTLGAAAGLRHEEYAAQRTGAPAARRPPEHSAT